MDLTEPGFSTRGAKVLAARARHWCARTPLGLAVLRHHEAGHILRDRRFRQGSYAWPDVIGLTGSFAEFWKRSIISLEGPKHKLLRQAAIAALSPDWIATRVPAFEAIAEALADSLPTPCAFVTDFSEPFAGNAIAALVGVAPEEAAALGHDASRLGLAMGMDAKRHEDIFNAATDRLQARARQLLARKPADSFATRLLAHATGLNPQEIIDLIVIAIFGGVDTTRAQLGLAAHLFARHPDQWALLRADPSLIPQAVEEVIRANPTTTWSTRQAVQDTCINGVHIPAGTTLHILVHATATDPAAVAEWSFDIRAKRKLHFGFGGGAHHCLGQQVARTDMAAALRVLAQRFHRIEPAGPATFLPDSGNTGPDHLPLRFLSA